MIVYNKLIRDNVPLIIERDNKTCITKVLNDTDFVIELKKKLVEEANELSLVNSEEELINELADISEVIDAIKKAYNIEDTEVINKQKKKAETNGKFNKKLFLVSVSKNNE